jgi:hypothetical protein
MNISPADITTLTVVENDSGLVRYAINSIKRFTSPLPAQIIIAHNGNSDMFLQEFRVDPRIVIVENPLDKSITHSSDRHGIGINKIMPLVKTKYTAIIESDLILLSDVWWHLDDSFDMKASQKSGAEWNYEVKDINYWFMCFVLFKTELFSGINWSTSKLRPFNVHPTIYNDSGWEMAGEVDRKQARIKELEYVKCKVGGKTKVFTKEFAYKSFELWENNEPICAHFYRGSDISRRPNPKKDLKDWMLICDNAIK